MCVCVCVFGVVLVYFDISENFYLQKQGGGGGSNNIVILYGIIW